jgi:hypothetical protein
MELIWAWKELPQHKPLGDRAYPKRNVVVRARATTIGSVAKKIAARPSSRPTYAVADFSSLTPVYFE